jgi:transcriptional regulator with PAS, ATPase and Fis domain
LEFHEHWTDDFPCAITVCDENGVILYMNKKSEKVFQDDGGKSLLGKNALDCHPAPSRSKFDKMLKDQSTNMYTIGKKGKKKLIYQAPWYKNGKFCGIVELSLEIPQEIPHFERG